MKTIAFLFLCLLLTPVFGAERALGLVANSPETVATSTVRIYRVHLANTSASTATITISDRTTNCGSAACQIWPTVDIAAHTVYVTDLGGITATSGFTIVSGTNNVVTAWISYSN